MQRILVLGAGFAGLWSAVAAARRLDELGAGPGEVEVLVVNRTAWHSIRVRNYEADLDDTLVPLADVLDPIGVKHVVAEVTDINVPERKVACTMDGALQVLTYDRLVFALGSRLAQPAIPGHRPRVPHVGSDPCLMVGENHAWRCSQAGSWRLCGGGTQF